MRSQSPIESDKGHKLSGYHLRNHVTSESGPLAKSNFLSLCIAFEHTKGSIFEALPNKLTCGGNPAYLCTQRNISLSISSFDSQQMKCYQMQATEQKTSRVTEMFSLTSDAFWAKHRLGRLKTCIPRVVAISKGSNNIKQKADRLISLVCR